MDNVTATSPVSSDSGAGSEAKTGVNQASPAQTEGSQQPASSGAQDGKTLAPAEQNLPFDKHPRWKQLQEERRRERGEFQQLQKQYQEQQGYLQALRQQGQPQGQQLPPDQKAQLDQLIEMLTPALKDKLGLGKLEELQKQFGELSTSWQSSQAESEMERVVSSVADLGLDPQEVRQEIEDAINTHPMYGDTGYRKGAIQAIFRDIYWDRRGELAERAVNSKEIKQREALKRGQTQGTSSSGKTASGAKSPDQLFAEISRDNGGIDFTR